MRRYSLVNVSALLIAVSFAAPSARAQEPEIAAAQAAARTQSRDAVVVRRHAVVLLRAGRFDDSMRAFHRVSQLRRNDPAALYEEASVGFAKNDYRVARSACSALHAHFSETVYYHVCLARSQLTLNRSARAFEELAIAVAIDPNVYELQHALGEAHRLRMDMAEGEAAYREAIRLAPSEAAPHLGLGRLYNAAGRRAEALTELRAAAALDPTWPDVQYELGALVGGAEGLALVRSAVTGCPRVAASQLALGDLEMVLGTPEAARVAYAAAIALDEHLVGARIGIGRALAALGRDAEAEVALAYALTMVPNSTATHMALGEIHARTERYEDAFEDYRRAADGSPGNPTPLLMGARLALTHGRDSLAQAFLDRLLAMNDGLGDAHALAGDVRTNRRDWPAAVAAYQRALATTNLTATERPRVQAALAEAQRRAPAH
jgi:tetratricopeptide (TPR) repeat protein